MNLIHANVEQKIPLPPKGHDSNSLAPNPFSAATDLSPRHNESWSPCSFGLKLHDDWHSDFLKAFESLCTRIPCNFYQIAISKAMIGQFLRHAIASLLMTQMFQPLALGMECLH